MSEVQEVEESSAEARAAPGLWAWAVSRPWWVQVLLVYAAARLFTTAVFLWVASVQEQNPWTARAPGLLPVRRPHVRRLLVQERRRERLPGAAAGGRGRPGPAERLGVLPAVPDARARAHAGHARPVGGRRPAARRSSWAPARCSPSTGRSSAARPARSPRGPASRWRRSPWSASSRRRRCCRSAYTEALALLLVASALLLLLRRDYGWMALVVVALGFTRAVALPMAVVVVVHAAVRWWSSRRGTDTFTWRTGTGLGGPGGARRGVRLPVARDLRLGHGRAGRVPADAGVVARASGRSRRSAAGSTCRSSGSRSGRSWWWALSFALVIAVLVVPAAWRLGRRAARVGGRATSSTSPPWWSRAAAWRGSCCSRSRSAAVTAGVVTRPPAARRWWFGAVVVLMLALQVLWVRQMWHANPVADWPP